MIYSIYDMMQQKKPKRKIINKTHLLSAQLGWFVNCKKVENPVQFDCHDNNKKTFSQNQSERLVKKLNINDTLVSSV